MMEGSSQQGKPGRASIHPIAQGNLLLFALKTRDSAMSVSIAIVRRPIAANLIFKARTTEAAWVTVTLYSTPNRGPRTASRENSKIPLSDFQKPCYDASFGQKRPPGGRPSEAGMVDERAPALGRRLTAHGRVLRRGRIFARLREGWAYDEIASQERLTAERVRQIVRKALEKSIVDEEAEHAKLQLARLQPAMRLAGEAIADGDVTAIAPLMKVLDRLDRYQRAAKAVQVYDDEARRKLMDKINRVAANLGVDEARAAKAGE